MSLKQDWSFEIQFFESILQKDPKYVDVIEALAWLYTQTGRVNEGLAMDQKLIALQPDKSIHHYNLACSLSLKKDVPAALRSLRKAVSLGYTDVEWMLQDTDLENLKNEPAFQKLIAHLKAGL